MSFFTKGCPATKVFATLTPLNLHATASNDPNMYITERTQPLVLRRDEGFIRVGLGTCAGLFIFNSCSCGTASATHDATTEIARKRQGRKVHETHEIGYNKVLVSFNVPKRFNDTGMRKL